MGWSIDLYRPMVDSIFKVAGKKYMLSHPESVTPTVILKFEGKLPMKALRELAKLFPDFVYVTFVPDTVFAEAAKGDVYEEVPDAQQGT